MHTRRQHTCVNADEYANSLTVRTCTQRLLQAGTRRYPIAAYRHCTRISPQLECMDVRHWQYRIVVGHARLADTCPWCALQRQRPQHTDTAPRANHVHALKIMFTVTYIVSTKGHFGASANLSKVHACIELDNIPPCNRCHIPITYHADFVSCHR